MARLGSIGFELQSVAEDVELSFIYGAVINTTEQRSGAACAEVSGSIAASDASGFDQRFATDGNAKAHLFARWYVKIADLPDSGNVEQYMNLADSTASTVVALDITNSSGTYSCGININDFGTFVGSFTYPSDGEWHRVECEYDSTPADGSEILRVYVDGVLEFEDTSLTYTQKTLVEAYHGIFNGSGSPVTTAESYMDDIAFNDDTGSFQNGLAGDGHIVHLHPNAVGDNTDWTPNASDNYAAVNEVTPDGDTSYVLSDVVTGSIDDYNLRAFKPGAVQVSETANTDPTVGTKAGDTVFVATGGGYLQFTDAVDFESGRYNFSVDLGQDFYMSSDLWAGGGEGGDASWFFWGASADHTTEDAAVDSYAIALDEFTDEIQLLFNGSVLTSSSSATLDNSTWRNLEVLVSGNNIKVWINGSQIFDFTDTTRTLGGTLFGWGGRTGSTNNEHRGRNFYLATGVSDSANNDITLVAVGSRFRGDGSTPFDTMVLRVKAASAGTVAESSGLTPDDTSYVTHSTDFDHNYQLVSYQKPGTTDDWTPSDLDSAQIGVRKSADATGNIRVTTEWLLVEYAPSAGQQFDQNIDDTVNASDTVAKTITVNISDDVNAADTTEKNAGKNISDDANASDASTKDVGKNIADNATADDNNTRDVAYQRTFADNVEAADATAKNTGKNIADSATTADATTAAKTKAITDQVNAQDATSQNVGKQVSDDVDTTDATAKNVGKGIDDQTSVFAGQRINLVPNPSFEVNITDGWSEYTTSGAITSERVTDDFAIGAASYKISAVTLSDAGLSHFITLPAGTYTFSGYVKTGAGVENAHLVIRENTGFLPLVQFHITANQDWQRYSGTFTLMAEQDCEILIGFGSYGDASDGEAWFDGLYLVEENTIGDYFDGSFPDAHWQGTPNNSTSIISAISKDIGKNLGDDVSASDDTTPQITVPQDIDDNVNAADATQLDVGKNLNEQVDTSDATAKAVDKAVSDDATAADATTKSVQKSAADDVSAADAQSFAVGKGVQDNVSVDDALANLVSKALADDVQVQDAVQTATTYMRLISDSVTAADMVAKNIVKGINEQVNAQDALHWLMTKILDDTVTVSDQVVAAIPEVFGGLEATLGQRDTATELKQKGIEVELTQRDQGTILSMRRQ